MLTNSRSYLVLIAVLSLLASGEAQAQLVQGGGSGIVTEPPPVVVTNCTITTADFINDAGPFHTASGTFVAIPGMTKAVKVDGTTSSCLLAVVSGDSMTTSGEAIYVGVTLDGHLGNPSFVQFSMNDPSAAQEHAALFAFRSVAPGTHTVAMVFKSAFGGTVSISRPAMGSTTSSPIRRCSRSCAASSWRATPIAATSPPVWRSTHSTREAFQ